MSWEEVLEHSTHPLQGTLARKQRKGVKLQVNNGRVYENATIYLEESKMWIAEIVDGDATNELFLHNDIESIKTITKEEEQ